MDSEHTSCILTIFHKERYDLFLVHFPAQEDAFTLLMKDVGQPQYLLVKSDGKSGKPTWHMDFALLESAHFPPAFFVAGTLAYTPKIVHDSMTNECTTILCAIFFVDKHNVSDDSRTK